MTYEGDFIKKKENDADKKMKHGRGTMKWQDGREYQGQFALDKMHGEGIMYWPTGAKYVGQYCDNRKAGIGKLTLPDGSSFEGNWYKGMRHGDFLYIDPDVGAFRMEYESDQVLKTENIGKADEWTLKPGYDVFVKSKGMDLGDGAQGSDSTCCICLGELCEGETICQMSCKHCFHKECIESWTTRKNQCPLCLRNIPTHKLCKAEPYHIPK